MLRKIGLLLILASLLTSIAFLAGCGAKGASQQTLTELEEARAACESARAKAKDLEMQRMDLEDEKAAKEAKVAELTRELDSLMGKKRIK